MSRVTTIQDSDGSVWTGKEIDTSLSPIEEIGYAVVTLGLGPAVDALAGDSGHRTVEVNGERHSGRRV